MGRLVPRVWVAAAITVAAGCGGGGSDGDGDAIRLAVEASVVFEPGTEPVALASLPDGDLLVGERRTGAVRRISANGGLSEPIVRVDVQAGPDDQRGLLGLAVTENHTYGAWTRATDGRIVVADLTDGLQRLVWEGPASSDLANGGHLATLPDGRLVIGIGDLQDPDRSADPDAPHGKLLALDPAGPPDQDPVALSQGWNNPFAFVVTKSGDIWVADNAPGDDPERIGRGDRASARVALPGSRAPSALVEIDREHLGLCGYLDGELRLVELTDDDEPQLEDTETAATGCRTGAVALSDSRFAVSDGEQVHILAHR